MTSDVILLDMYKTAGVSFNPLADRLLTKLLKLRTKDGEPIGRSPYICRLIVEEAKRQGIFDDKK